MGDLNNDGLEDVVFGRREDTVFIYFKNADRTITLFQKLMVPGKNRSTAELVDFNGNGLLDLVVTSHHVSCMEERVKIYFNRGTKELPEFNEKNTEQLYINGNPASYIYCNLLFRDLNNDKKKDMIFFHSDKKYYASFYYSLNVSISDSIILGPIHKLKFQSTHIVNPMRGVLELKPPSSNGNKIVMAYFDTNNDGINEFYLNSWDDGWVGLFDKDAVDLENEHITEMKEIKNIQYIGNKIILQNSMGNSQISIVDLKGRVVDTRVITMEGKKEIALNNLSAGSYFLRIKNDDIIQTLKFVKME